MWYLEKVIFAIKWPYQFDIKILYEQHLNPWAVDYMNLRNIYPYKTILHLCILYECRTNTHKTLAL